MNLKELREKLLKLLTEARDIAAKAEEEERDFNGDERQKVANLLEEAKTVKEQIKEKEGDEALRKQLDAFGDEIGLSQNGSGDGLNKKAGARYRQTPAHDTLGQAFLESEEWAKYFKGISRPSENGGRVISDSVKGISPPLVGV